MRDSGTSVRVVIFLATAATLGSACSQTSNGPAGGSGGSASGGAASGGDSGRGGASATGGVAGGGASGAGGANADGGRSGSGGASAAGGTASGGGIVGKGGATSTGGKTGGDGGIAADGGAGAGGSTGAGGGTATGGSGGTGGTAAGGGTGAGGATSSGGNGDAAPPAKDGAPFRDGAPAEVADVAKEAPLSDAGGATCTGQPVPAAGDRTVTLQHGGRARKYILHVPSGLTAGMALPVVIDLHGAGGNGSQQKGMSGFSSLADKEKFLAVFPDGIDGYWNVDDTCCGTAGKEKIDDVAFLLAIVDKLGAETCIDAKRIYASGFSNGGGLAHRLGCDAADVFAAIAPTGTDLRTQPCNAARPISMMEVRGMADSLEPYEGGLVGPAGGQYESPGAKGSLKLWAEINKCTGTATTIEKYCESYTQCAGGVETDLCSLPNVDHSPYGNSLGFNVASVAWSMFKRQPLK